MDNNLLKFGMKVWLISIVVIVVFLAIAIICLAQTKHQHISSKGETWYEQEEASAESMLGIYCIECGEYLREQTLIIKSIVLKDVISDTTRSFNIQETSLNQGQGNQGQGNKGQGSQGKGQGQEHGKGKGHNK